MANLRGAPQLPRPRLRRLLRSPVSRLACLLLALAGLVLLSSLSQVARVDGPRRDGPVRVSQVSSDALWASNGYGYHACVTPTSRYKAPTESDRYMTVRSNGGLNQMRTGICDMVAVARLVNATLVIPQLDKRSFWQDTSKFNDIFDDAHFIKALEGDVRIVSDLPESLQSAPRARKHFTSWASASYYEEVKELWKDNKELLATKEELEKFKNHASQVAALDYIISVESDVFVPSHSGNMAKAVEGHRRFLGHRKTITPDRRGLVKLFDLLENGELMEGPKLSTLVTEMHKDRQGTPRNRYGSLPGTKGRARHRTEESFYENPLPECICPSRMQ